MMWDGGMSWAWFSGWIVMIIFGGGILAFIIWFIVRFSKGDSHITTASNALDIAKERYARGEITKSEFEQIKKDLEK